MSLVEAKLTNVREFIMPKTEHPWPITANKVV